MKIVTITKKEKSTVEIDLTLPAAVFDAYENKAIEVLRERVKIDGFRKKWGIKFT